MSQPTEQDATKLKLQEPKTQLAKPERSGSGMLIAGGVVVVVMCLIWILRGGETSRPTQVKLTPSQGSDAADQVEKLTNELIERSKDSKPSNFLKVADEQISTLSLNGVQFRVALPPGWKPILSGTQIMVRKEKDPRICQLTSDPKYDIAGLIGDVKGKESEFEAQYTKEALSRAASGAQVTASGTLLASDYGKNRLHYAVRTKVKMTSGSRFMEQGGVNAVYAVGSRMVRLQCMNMSGTSDEADVMKVMGKSLLIPST